MSPKRFFVAGVRPVDRIVVPVGGTDREFVAEQWAVEMASALSVPIRAIHVEVGEEEPSEVFRYLEEECEKWGVDLEKITLQGTDVVAEIMAEVRPRDLIVVGTRRLATQYHVGSVAARLVREAPCPVQIVRLD